MPAGKRHIIFQAYGHQDILNECVFALLSLSQTQQANWADIDIWIYTDKPEWFQSFTDCPLPITYRKIDAETIQQWRGAIDFTHRVKIELLKDVTAKTNGSYLYIDTDAVITQSLSTIFEQIEKGALFMHIAEGRIETNSQQPMLKKLARFLNSSERASQTVPQQATMWNAGVLGFNDSHVKLLHEALAMTDELYPLFPKHIVEQFAFSIVFAKAQTIHAAAPAIVHYWNLKELRQVLSAFFEHYKNGSWDALTAAAAQIKLPALMQDKISFLHNISVWDKLAKKRWQPQIPAWS